MTTPETCPGCQSKLSGIDEGRVFYDCGSFYGQSDGKLIYTSAECNDRERDLAGLFNQE